LIPEIVEKTPFAANLSHSVNTSFANSVQILTTIYNLMMEAVFWGIQILSRCDVAMTRIFVRQDANSPCRAFLAGYNWQWPRLVSHIDLSAG
jgi:hypothetical protein